METNAYKNKATIKLQKNVCLRKLNKSFELLFYLETIILYVKKKKKKKVC